MSVSQNDDDDQQVSDQAGNGKRCEHVAERDREQFAQIVHVVMTFYNVSRDGVRRGREKSGTGAQSPSEFLQRGGRGGD